MQYLIMYSTGIPTKMWYILKLIPAILWMIELVKYNTFKTDCLDKLNLQHNSNIIDTTLLFKHSIDPKHVNNSYQILNILEQIV